MTIKKACKVFDNLNRFIKNHHVKNLILNQLFIFVLSVLSAFSQINTTEIKQQKSKTSEQNISLFDSEEPLEISLRFDLAGYLKKSSKGDSFDAVMTIHFSKTDSLDKKITIKYRGTSRFQRCKFPPIQLNFNKPVYINSDSVKTKKLKLVNHCEQGTMYDEYVLREYLVYKLFNVLTDTSFRVRLLKVNYMDTKRSRKPITQYGFFIEPIELLAGRTNSFVVKATNLSQKHIIPVIMDRLAIFNYMISNWDWSIPGQHNVAIIKPIKNDVTGLGIAIPFDFDLTGVVNADYAIPPPGMEITTNRERLFSGICRSKEVFQEDLKIFLNKKEKLYSVINGFPYLNQRAKKDITNFLDQFFDQLEKQKSLDNLVDCFLNSCKKL
ncbi:MAG TPA: hypothetical protein VIK14_12905 [Ignavibacteria bacterium]